MNAMRIVRKIFRIQTPDDCLQETHEVLLRSARRCAYDLKHAIEYIAIKDKFAVDLLTRKAAAWEALFSSGNAVKDYKLKLHLEISDLTYEVERLKKILDDRGIDHHRKNEIPW